MCLTPYINKPLLNLQYLTIYKIWLVNFPIDVDCHKVIKQFLCKLCMNRRFSYPSSRDIYDSMFLTTLNKNCIVYINEQGIVFRQRHYSSYDNRVIKPEIGYYRQTNLYTNRSIFKNILTKDIDSLIVTYSKDIFEIDLQLSDVQEISIDGSIFSFSPKAHKLIEYQITAI